MMTRWSVAASLMLALSCAPAFAQSEARTLSTGGHYARLGIAWHTASSEFGLDGAEQSLFADTANFHDASFGQTDLMLYGELGLFDWLTGIAETHFRTLVREAHFVPTDRDSSVSASGLGDLWLRARFRLLDTAIPQSAAVTIGWKAPTGSPRQEIPLGTGVADYSVGAAFRTPWTVGGVDGHAECGATYLLRINAANEMVYGVEVGVDAGRGVLLHASLDGVHSTADFDGASTDPLSSTINRSLVGDQAYTAWEAGVRLAVEDGLDLGAFIADRLGGRNSPATSSFGLFIAWHGP